MELLTKTKDHILVSVIIIAAGIFAMILAMVKGYFGIAVEAFLGLLACSSVLIFILPVLLKGEEKK
jgi:predicted exporter